MPDRTTRRVTVLASQAIASAVNSEKRYVERELEASVFLNVTAGSGTSPTLAPIVQKSDDDGTTWYTISNTWIEEDGSTVTSLTDATGGASDGLGAYTCQVSNIGKHLRIRFPAPGGSGSPSFTLSAVIESKN